MNPPEDLTDPVTVRDPVTNKEPDTTELSLAIMPFLATNSFAISYAFFPCPKGCVYDKYARSVLFVVYPTHHHHSADGISNDYSSASSPTAPNVSTLT